MGLTRFGSGILRHLRAVGIAHLAVFGSTARGEAGPDSDVDLLAAFDADARLSLLDVVHLEGWLSNLLGRPVDLVEDTALRPSARAAAARDLVDASVSGHAVPQMTCVRMRRF